jgi:tetratricopeptide (TPR) repeat protein
MSKKPGRNDPCPCGSGKKYKKCCLSKDAATASKQAASPQTHSNPQQVPAAPPLVPPPVVLLDDDDDLDELSNNVVDLIREGKLDEAEKACDELDRRFPEMIDCLERRAMFLEARGETKLAAEYYRRAAEHARTHEGFDTEIVDSYLASANKLDPSPDSESS